MAAELDGGPRVTVGAEMGTYSARLLVDVSRDSNMGGSAHERASVPEKQGRFS